MGGTSLLLVFGKRTVRSMSTVTSMSKQRERHRCMLHTFDRLILHKADSAEQTTPSRAEMSHTRTQQRGTNASVPTHESILQSDWLSVYTAQQHVAVMMNENLSSPEAIPNLTQFTVHDTCAGQPYSNYCSTCTGSDGRKQRFRRHSDNRHVI